SEARAASAPSWSTPSKSSMPTKDAEMPRASPAASVTSASGLSLSSRRSTDSISSTHRASECLAASASAACCCAPASTWASTATALARGVARVASISFCRVSAMRRWCPTRYSVQDPGGEEGSCSPGKSPGQEVDREAFQPRRQHPGPCAHDEADGTGPPSCAERVGPEDHERHSGESAGDDPAQRPEGCREAGEHEDHSRPANSQRP